jgi:hypothetical protein
LDGCTHLLLDLWLQFLCKMQELIIRKNFGSTKYQSPALIF